QRAGSNVLFEFRQLVFEDGEIGCARLHKQRRVATAQQRGQQPRERDGGHYHGNQQKERHPRVPALSSPSSARASRRSLTDSGWRCTRPPRQSEYSDHTTTPLT